MQISWILEVFVPTGVGVEFAFVPRPAKTGPLETGRIPVPARCLDPSSNVTATSQLPA